MQTMIQLTTLRDAPSRSQLEIQDHPVFQALPPAVQDRALTNGRLKMLAPGEEVDDDEGLFFVLAGVLGLFPGRQRICVSLVVAGSVYGWDQALDAHAPQSTARAIVETLVCRVPAESVLAPLGRDWLTRLVARQAPTRLHFMAAEAACNASHLVAERLAKWLVRLHCGANGAPLRLPRPTSQPCWACSAPASTPQRADCRSWAWCGLDEARFRSLIWPDCARSPAVAARFRSARKACA